MIPTAVLTAQYAGTVEVFETSRLDARTNQPLAPAPTLPSGQQRDIAIAGDASYAPVIRIRLNDRRWDYTFSYAPTFTVTDFELLTSAQPVVINAGTAGVAWHDRFVRIAVTESASYGWENLAYLYGLPLAGQPTAAGQSQTGGQTTTGQAPTTGVGGGQTATGGQLQPPATVPLQTFPFGSSITNATVSVRTSRDVTLFVGGGYSVTGNLSNNAAASTVYPEQFGPSGSASLSYAPSRTDTFATMASAQQTTTPMGACVPQVTGQTCRQVTPVMVLQETYRRRLTKTASVSATAGVSATVYPLVNETAWGIFPVAGVSYADRFGAAPKDPLAPPAGIRVAADLSPTINVFTGAPSNRIQLSATVVRPLAPDVILSFTGGVLQTVPLPQPDPSPLTLVNFGVDARFQLNPLLSLSLGVSGFWQAQQNVGALPVATGGTTGPSSSASEVGYVALTVRAPKLRL